MSTQLRYRLVIALIAGLMSSAALRSAARADAGRYNVLFIAVDDLRPELACYGARHIHSPNIDRLAATGTRFNRAYCQQAVCSPSRTSLLTGLRPDSTRVYDLNTHFRMTVPDVVTLPQHFRRQGYHTQSFGKIYHGGLDDPQSWSVPSEHPQRPTYHRPESLAALEKRREEIKATGELQRNEVVKRDDSTGMPLKLRRVGRRALGPAWEDPDVADSELSDGRIADRAIETLRELKDKRFFLAVGFYKPHLPFVAPKKYFDLYPPESVRLPDNPFPPRGVPQIALTDFGELRQYSDMLGRQDLGELKALELRRAYYAATSFIDAQIGRVLDEIEQLGLAGNTVVVLWGDHGWQLGEHGLWCKHTNFEIATRAPLLLRWPGQVKPGTASDALVEFVDIYPTLCELCELPVPDGLEGVSMAPLLVRPDRPWKKAAFSQYPRGKVMGHSIRTDRYRYTEWAEPGQPPTAVELYDHDADPGENVNLANRVELDALTAGLSGQLRAGWQGALPEGIARPAAQSSESSPGRTSADPDCPSILFCIADDWSYPHAGAYGDRVVKTPTFDRLAGEGILFTHAFCAAPSCTPSRGAVLTGQAIHRLGAGGNLWSRLPGRFAVYPDLLEEVGYFVGYTRKGWSPGTIEGTGRTRNPAGPQFKSFEDFLNTRPAERPFCFWFGSVDPHRPYEKGSGAGAGMKPEEVVVPPWLPDTPEVRDDILDYYFEVQRFDREVGELLELLETRGLRHNTMVVMTSDNGMPFPRAKANLYDSGTRMPLAISWPARIKGGRVVDAFVSFTDFAPTFLRVAGWGPPPDMAQRGLVDLLTGKTDAHHDKVFLERERHANTRRGNLSYPARAVRTRDFLYVRNLRPDAWPAGDPELWHCVGPFGDIDGSPSKDVILDRRDDPEIRPFFDLACAKRPAEELYELANDPEQLRNVADDPALAGTRRELRAELDHWMEATEDPRAAGVDDRYDRYAYHGRPVAGAPGAK